MYPPISCLFAYNKDRVACVFCQRSHMSCNDERPCQRCIKRNISHLCRDKDPINDSADGRKPEKPSADGVAGSQQTIKDRGMVPIAPAIKAAMDGDSSSADRLTNSASIHVSVSTPHLIPGATASSSNAQAMTVVDSSVLPIIASAHSNVLPMGTGSTPTSQAFVSDTAGSSHGLHLQSQSNSTNMDIDQSNSTHLYGGARFDNNSLLSFGNDVASNEFSALNEFLESLQRNMRNAERIDSDVHLSNPPSGSPSEQPSIRAVSSPLVDQFGHGNQLGGNTNSSGMQSSHTFQNQYASIPSNASKNTNSTVRSTMPVSAVGGQDQDNHMHQDRTHSLPTISQLMTDRKGEGVTQTERFLLTAADPSDGTSEDKLRQIINAKYEAGILKPYNYVNGYTRMQKYMETNISKQNIIRILEVINTFRPTFRSIAQSLTDIDLLLVEEGFERLLLDYDNVFNSFGVPACLWRRTGEIYKANREFADLMGVPLSYFHDGKVCIYELLTESSTVNYWEKYGEIAFDATQKAVLTSCVLQTAASVRTLVHNGASKRLGDSRPMSSSSIALKIGGMADQPSPSQPGRPVRCCFSFTLRRDKYKIPLAIIGNFMPIQH
ncbi:Transcription factor [Coemansia sp. RSA 1843]|nr:Transcription factor [Coemansia sp. RSA 1843]